MYGSLEICWALRIRSDLDDYLRALVSTFLVLNSNPDDYYCMKLAREVVSAAQDMRKGVIADPVVDRVIRWAQGLAAGIVLEMEMKELGILEMAEVKKTAADMAGEEEKGEKKNEKKNRGRERIDEDRKREKEKERKRMWRRERKRRVRLARRKMNMSVN
jgi:hypothetical protein